jgi:hypothetical protein
MIIMIHYFVDDGTITSLGNGISDECVIHRVVVGGFGGYSENFEDEIIKFEDDNDNDDDEPDSPQGNANDPYPP